LPGPWHAVAAINANLTAGLDLTRVHRLADNFGIAFMGDSKGGPFEIPESIAREMLSSPNPDGRSNAEIVRPWMNGLDLYGRPRNMWIIDFGVNMPLDQAVLYERPFEYVKAHVMPRRVNNRRQAYAERWWLHVEARSGMRTALAALGRFIGTVRHSKHRIFAWIPHGTLPDSALIVFARDDDYFFGVLHSRPHELWARGLGTQVREVESGFRYTPTTTFETFPMPEPSPEAAEAIAAAARELNDLREGWLNPRGADTSLLQRRTLTNLYNERPTWLDRAHERLDQAVHAAYGWPYPLGDEEILGRLIALNLSQSEEQGEGAGIE
jgi:type II restriction/modification system DNA methylase subunit YeeA